MYIIISDWKLFMMLLLSIVVPHEASAKESAEHTFVNTMVMAPLKAVEKRAVIIQAYNDLVNVVNYLFLPNLGCINLCAEWYLSTGANTYLPEEWPNEEHPACNNNWYVCKGSFAGDMLPIFYEGAVRFLDSKYFSG